MLIKLIVSIVLIFSASNCFAVVKIGVVSLLGEEADIINIGDNILDTHNIIPIK